MAFSFPKSVVLQLSPMLEHTGALKTSSAHNVLYTNENHLGRSNPGISAVLKLPREFQRATKAEHQCIKSSTLSVCRCGLCAWSVSVSKIHMLFPSTNTWLFSRHSEIKTKAKTCEIKQETNEKSARWHNPGKIKKWDGRQWTVPNLRYFSHSDNFIRDRISWE